MQDAGTLHRRVDERVGGGETPRKRIDWSLAYWLAAAIGAFALLAMVTAPVADLLGPSAYAIPSTLHGASAMVYVIISTVLVYMGWRLFEGRLEAYRDLRILAALQAFLSLITIMFGNWIYIFYRASDGPRRFFLENDASLHEIFFEFKEFIALFTLPMSVAAAFIAWHARDELSTRPSLQKSTAVLLWLSWGFLMLAFGLGAAITKIRSV